MTATRDAPPSAQEQGATVRSVCAVLEAAGQRIGVSASAIVQIIPRPEKLAVLPGAHTALVGVCSYQRRSVPVIDLRRWGRAGGDLNEKPSARAGHLAVLCSGSHWMGLLVDSVHEVVTLQPRDIERVQHQNHAEAFFHSVALLGVERTPLTLLDVPRLMAQSLVWSGGAGSTPPSDSTHSNTTPGLDQREPLRKEAAAYAVVQLGERLYALPALSLAEVLPTPSLQTVVDPNSGLLGVLKWRGRDVPVVNPLPLLGDAQPLLAAPWLAIVEHDERCIALPCHGLERVSAYTSANIQSADEGSVLCSAACTGVVIQDEGLPIRVISVSSLMRAFHVSNISRAKASELAKHAQTQRNDTALVVFQARSRFAVPIDQLQEIMSIPPDFTAEAGSGALRGSVTWRGQAVPVMDLQCLLWPNVPSLTMPSRMLVTRLLNQLTALLVGDVEILIPPHAGVLTAVRMPGGDTMHMVTTQDSSTGDKTSYSMIDLSSLPLVAA